MGYDMTKGMYYNDYTRYHVKPTVIPDMTLYRSIKIMFHKYIPSFNFSKRALKFFSQCYNGSGFMIFNKSNLNKIFNKCTIYDINSAYQYSLINNIYPLSDKYTISNKVFNSVAEYKKVFTDKLTIMFIKVKDLRQKYPDNIYNIYEKQMSIGFDKEGGIYYCGWICNIDLYNFNKLYNYSSIVIEGVRSFDSTGKLGSRLEMFIKNMYNKLNSMPRDTDIRKQYKIMFHIATYGKSAQMNNIGLRSQYVPIAIYQTAYVRQRMIQLFLKYKKDVLYIDTDSIFIKKGFKEQIGDDIGLFKIEHKNIYTYIFRGKGYFIFDNKKKLIKQVVSGVNTDFTRKEIEKIFNGIDFYKVIDKEGKPFKVLIQNKHKKGYNIAI